MTTPGFSPVLDRFERPLGSLRLSVTDRCNMRCRYCMPEESYVWLPRASLLSFEELERLVRIFAGLGSSKVRLTGGEPLLRHDLPALVAQLRAVEQVDEIALTTNGLLLRRHAEALKATGLDRVTVSLDTLRPDRALAFARTDRHADILDGVRAAREAGFVGTKLNTVVIRGFNDDELVDLLEYGRRENVEVRFIEYMDVGGATRWSYDDVVARREMLERIGAHYGGVEAIPSAGPAPAERFRLPDGTVFGIIASTTEPFCRSCDRSRVTADGTWYLCLYAAEGVDLREPLRSGAGDAEIAELIRRTWSARADRGAEARLAAPDRSALYQLESLRADPRREMHTRGG
ncbi:MAG: GTP 3',8-cyclase MoaA [Gemmatimonadales bacterium]